MYVPLKAALSLAAQVLLKDFDGISARARAAGGDVSVEHATVPMPVLEELVATALADEDVDLKRACAEFHANTMLNLYTAAAPDVEYAQEQGDLAFRFKEFLRGAQANNVGYMYLRKLQLEEASALFRKAIESWSGQDDALLCYNLGLCKLLNGDKAEARKIITEAVERHKTLSVFEDMNPVLFVPEHSEAGAYRLQEVRNARLSEVCAQVSVMLQ